MKFSSIFQISQKDIISIGGAHIQQPKVLPKDLQNFLDGSDTIYFSLGTILELPKEKMQMILGGAFFLSFSIFFGFLD